METRNLEAPQRYAPGGLGALIGAWALLSSAWDLLVSWPLESGSF